MKFILALFVVLCFGIIVSGKSGKCGDNLSWEYNDETATLTISGTGAMSCTTESSSPWKSLVGSMSHVDIQNGVTSIGTYAFYKFKNITSITVPSSVTSIEAWAFSSCEALESFTIPSGVTEIADYTFYRCLNMRSVTIPSNLQTIGIHAFRDCQKLTSINLPSTVTKIGDSAFNHCESLTSFTIPPSVTTISDQCFNGCYNMTSINIHSGVTSIGSAAFYNCYSLKSVTIPDVITSLAFGVFYGCKSLKSITLPDAITAIGVHTFSGCTNLRTVNLPPGLTSIANFAFRECTSLGTITIPSHVTSIGDEAFGDCTNLDIITYLGSSDPKNGKNIFKGCDNLKLVCIEQNYTSTSFCGLDSICKSDSCKSVSNGPCYQPACVNGVIEMQKRENASTWEQKSTPCYEFLCSRKDGPIFWKECNSSDTKHVCETDQCIDVSSEKEVMYAVQIDVEGMGVPDMNMTEIREIVSDISNVEALELKIRANINDKSNVVDIIVIVENESVAKIVKNAINRAIKEHGGDEVIKYFVSAQVVKIEPELSSGIMNKGNIIMIIMSLYVCDMKN